jgi:hypothetical protein
VASVILFYKVSIHYLEREDIPLALCLFAVSDRLIYYSSEVKQYSSDVAVALLVWLVALHMHRDGWTYMKAVAYGLLGAVAVWLAYPSVFILSGIGLSSSLFLLIERKWRELGRFCVASLLWASSFVVLYFVSLRSLSHNSYLEGFWSSGFIPFPPKSVWDLKWFFDTFFNLFTDPLGFAFCGVAGLAFLLGGAVMFLKKRRDFCLLVSPVLPLALASGCHLYPLQGRLLLFVVPFVLLFVAKGVEMARVNTSSAGRAIWITLASLLVLPPLAGAAYHFFKPRTGEETKPVLSYLREHWRSGDFLYVYYGAESAFQYYSEHHRYKSSDYLMGVESRDNWSKYFEDLDKLRGRQRVWIFFSHICTWSGVDEEKLFLFHLDSIGTGIKSFNTPGADLYLYDLSKDRAP